jgi:hypothetical protein
MRIVTKIHNLYDQLAIVLATPEFLHLVMCYYCLLAIGYNVMVAIINLISTNNHYASLQTSEFIFCFSLKPME